eukprot:gene26324-31800_t
MGKGKRTKAKVAGKPIEDDTAGSGVGERDSDLTTPNKASNPQLPPPFPVVDDKPESQLPNVETQASEKSPLPAKSPLVQFASVYPNEEEEIDFYIPPTEATSTAEPMKSPQSIDMKDLYPNTEKQDEVPQPTPHPSTPPVNAPSTHPLITPSPCRYSFISADNSLTEIVFERSVVEEEAVEVEGVEESVWRVVANEEDLANISTPMTSLQPHAKSTTPPGTSIMDYGELAVEYLTHVLYTYAPLYLDIHTLTEYIEEMMVSIPYIQILLPTLLIRVIKVSLIWSVMYMQFVGMCVWQLAKWYIYVCFYLPYSFCVAGCVWIVKMCAYGAVRLLNGVGKKTLPVAVNGHHTKSE